MAATLSIAPPSASLSKDPIYVEVQTNNIALGSRAQYVLVFSSTGPADGNTFSIAYLGKSLLFTAKDTPANNGLEIPTMGTNTLPEYLDIVAESFFQNEVLADDFRISVDTTINAVKFRYKDASPILIEIENNLANTSPSNFTNIDHAGPLLEKNLSAVLRVETWDSEILGVFNVPYSALNGKAIFDIQSAFRHLYINLPSLNTAVMYGAANNMSQKYAIRIADKYGDVPKSEALLLTNLDSYTAVLGRSRGDNLGLWQNTNSGAILLHNRPSEDYVLKDQPQYMYVFFKNFDEIIYGLNIKIFAKLNTGETIIFTPTINVMVKGNSVAWFATGYNHISLDQYLKGYTLNPNIFITEYAYTINYGTTELAAYKYKIIRKCPPSTLYFLCENGLGGLEVIRLSGINTEESQATREEIEKVRWMDWSATEGDIDDIEVKGQKFWKCQSELLQVSEIEKMKQLLLGKIWILHENSWKRVISDSKSISSPNFNLKTGYVNVNFKAAWYDHSFNDL